MFEMKDDKGKEFKPDMMHTQMVSKFLNGETKHNVGSLLETWLKCPLSKPSRSHGDARMEYSPDAHYQSIGHAFSALTAFAAQLVKKEIVREANRTARKDGGLHTFASRAGSSSAGTNGESEKIVQVGAQIFPNATEIFKNRMPLTWSLALSLAAADESAITRERRPPHVVSSIFHLMII